MIYDNAISGYFSLEKEKRSSAKIVQVQRRKGELGYQNVRRFLKNENDEKHQQRMRTFSFRSDNERRLKEYSMYIIQTCANPPHTLFFERYSCYQRLQGLKLVVKMKMQKDRVP